MKNRVLIIDDNVELASLIGIYLDSMGMEATQVENLSEAKLSLEEGIFDYIICDYNLEKENAFELIEYCHQKGLNTQFLVITGNLALTEKSCMDLGASGLMQKPFMLQELYEKVKQDLSQEGAEPHIVARAVDLKKFDVGMGARLRLGNMHYPVDVLEIFESSLVISMERMPEELVNNVVLELSHAELHEKRKIPIFVKEENREIDLYGGQIIILAVMPESQPDWQEILARRIQVQEGIKRNIMPID